MRFEGRYSLAIPIYILRARTSSTQPSRTKLNQLLWTITNHHHSRLGWKPFIHQFIFTVSTVDPPKKSPYLGQGSDGVLCLCSPNITWCLQRRVTFFRSTSGVDPPGYHVTLDLNHYDTSWGQEAGNWFGCIRRQANFKRAAMFCWTEMSSSVVSWRKFHYWWMLYWFVNRDDSDLVWLFIGQDGFTQHLQPTNMIRLAD